VLEPPGDAFAESLFGASSLPMPQGLTTPLKPEMALASLAIRQPGESASVLDDLAQES